MQKIEMKEIIKICNIAKWSLLAVAVLVFAINYDAPNIQSIVADIIQILNPVKDFEGIDTPFDNFTNL